VALQAVLVGDRPQLSRCRAERARIGIRAVSVDVALEHLGAPDERLREAVPRSDRLVAGRTAYACVRGGPPRRDGGCDLVAGRARARRSGPSGEARSESEQEEIGAGDDPQQARDGT